MQRGMIVARGINRPLDDGVFKKISTFNRGFDTRVFLVNDAPGTNVDMPDFGVAHLCGGQADPLFGGVDNGVRIGVPEKIPVRFTRLADGVVVTRFTVAKSIEYDQQSRSYLHDF